MTKKTVKQFLDYLEAQVGQPYWYGCMGEIASESLYLTKKALYPYFYKDQDYVQQYGKKVHDCSGLIRGFLMCEDKYHEPFYNSEYDLTDSGFYRVADEKGDINTFQYIPGTLLHADNHVGVYVGNNQVIQALNHSYGVVKSSYDKSSWQRWSLCPFINYSSVSAETIVQVDNAVECDSYFLVNTKKLNCRNKPSIDSGLVIGVFTMNSIVGAIQSVDDWVLVKGEKLIGWCKKEYLLKIDPEVLCEVLGDSIFSVAYQITEDVEYKSYPTQYNSLSLGAFKKGEMISTKRYLNRWYLVSNGDRIGWIEKKYLTKFIARESATVTSDYIGKYVKQFESGSTGAMTFSQSGFDWGLSAGTYQLTLRWGNAIGFLKMYFSKEADALYYNGPDIKQGEWPGLKYCSSPDEVKDVWVLCYNKYGREQIEANEREYIRNKYYSPMLREISSVFNPDTHSRMAQECCWSWAIHKGPYGAANELKLSITGIDPYSLTTEQLLDRFYDQRYLTAQYDRYSKTAGENSERETLRKYCNLAPLGGSTLSAQVNKKTSADMANELNSDLGESIQSASIQIESQLKKNIKYRSGPSVTYPSLGEITVGTEVIAIRKCRNWYFIKLNKASNPVGWISAEYVKT